MFSLGFAEIAVILIFGLLILGPRDLADSMRWLGKTFRDLRRSLHLLHHTWQRAASPEEEAEGSKNKFQNLVAPARLPENFPFKKSPGSKPNKPPS